MKTIKMTTGELIKMVESGEGFPIAIANTETNSYAKVAGEIYRRDDEYTFIIETDLGRIYCYDDDDESFDVVMPDED